MLMYPLSEVEAGIYLSRMNNPDNCKIVGSHGHFFIKEERLVKSPKTGIEAGVVTMHGRALGRHTHHKKDRRVIAGKVAKVAA